MTQSTPVSSPFAITAAANSVRLDASRKAETAFSVTNATGRAITGRAIIQPSSPETASWFSLAGPAERPFQPNEAFQYNVSITVPPTAAPGAQVFTLNMVDVANPDEFFSQGPPVSVEVPAPVAPAKSFNWAIPIAAIVAILAIGGVLAYLLLRPDPDDGIGGTTSVKNFDLIDLDTNAGVSDLTFDDLLVGALSTPTSPEFMDAERRAGQVEFWFLVATNSFAYNEATGRVHDGTGLSFGDENTQYILIGNTHLVYATSGRVIDLRGAMPTEAACFDCGNSPSRNISHQLTGPNVAFCLQTSEGKRSFVQIGLGAARTDPATMSWSTE